MDMTKYAGSESKYLKAGDLKGKSPTVQIESVELVEFENDGKREVKPAIHFVGGSKAMVLNATNTSGLMEKFGSDSDGWIGKKVMLSKKEYPNYGKPGVVLTGLPEDDFDDSIPF